VKTHRARHSEAAKEADRPQPKGEVERTVEPVSVDGGARMFHRAIESSLPTTHLDLDQLGKPNGPHPSGGIPTARKEDGPEGRGCRRKRRPACNRPDRAMPVPKGSPLPAGVTESDAPALLNLPGR
jgi:hypothetical protein